MAASAGIPWYRTGTVNVTQNSAIITGTDTQWEANGVREGDIFTVDSQKFYEVASVNSNTNITLRDAYTAATRISQPYAIIRNFSTPMLADLAKKLAELVSKYEDRFDDAPSTP